MTNKKNTNKLKNKGFTLVELAIVIVIIGLLVGGVLQGQELITQSKIRSQVKQIEEFNAATAIFRSKYDGLPGDLINPSRFGFFGATYGNTPLYLGNGIIQDENGNYPPTTTNAESVMFFINLQQAKMIKGLLPYSNSGGNSCYNNGNYSRVVGCQFPEGKIGKGGLTAYTGRDGGLYYYFGISNYDTTIYNIHTFLALSANPVVSPQVSDNLDRKLDDGVPSSGNIEAIRVTAAASTNLSDDTTLNNCLGASNQVYNLSTDSPLCRLSIKAAIN